VACLVLAVYARKGCPGDGARGPRRQGLFRFDMQQWEWKGMVGDRRIGFVCHVQWELGRDPRG
jgi:hypothetical protein